ncbi:hypothetical protein CEXT_71781 [Caerostris extrusa]|uniref:Uncharacterized protein n=1 Tax=Caerostris extrusa TaxID=172846 RepID=A0AAV4T9R7_CAEEX|nr:hypothetical protein CEXT_71781 [Caerostris extrusa]
MLAKKKELKKGHDGVPGSLLDLLPNNFQEKSKMYRQAEEDEKLHFRNKPKKTTARQRPRDKRRKRKDRIVFQVLY